MLSFGSHQRGVASGGTPADPVLAVEALGPAAEVPGVLATGEGGSRRDGRRAACRR